MNKVARWVACFSAVLIIICSCLTLASAETGIPSATSDFYVNDFAGIFSEEEKTQLMSNAVQLANNTDGIQLVITTVDSLRGMSIEAYANKMYNQYGIGRNDMGILILLSVDDRQIRIEVGLAMEAYVTDAKAGHLLDQYAIPYLRNNHFSAGLISLQEATIQEIQSAIEKETTAKNDQTAIPNDVEHRVVDNSSQESSIQSNGKEEKMNTFFFVGFIVSCAFSLILIACFIAKSIQHRNEVDYLLDDNKEKDRIIKEFEERISKVKDEMRMKLQAETAKNQSLQEKIVQCTQKIAKQEDTLQRANKLYPSLKSDIAQMIQEEKIQRDKEAAKKVDQVIAKVIDLPASKDIVSNVKFAIQSFENLTQDQKKYVFSDISRLKKLYNDSFSLKKKFDQEQEEKRNRQNAEKATTSILELVENTTTGRESNLRKLKQAKSILDALNPGALPFFDDTLAKRVRKLYQQAKQDEEENERRRRREEEEEEERRRRMNSTYSHSSSYSSFGGFSGFGGHSGGGGASRGF